MKNLFTMCLSMFLTLGLCSLALAANEGNADKAKGNADKAGAAKVKVEKAAKQEKAMVKEKAGEVAKDANEVKGVMEKRAKGKDAEKVKEVKADAEKEMKGKVEKVEKDADKANGTMEGRKDIEGRAKGKGHMQQSGAREKQLVHEQEKHNSRMARLQRIKELAQQDGDAKTVERVDKLIANENDRFIKKTGKMEEKAVDATQKAAGKQP